MCNNKPDVNLPIAKRPAITHTRPSKHLMMWSLTHRPSHIRRCGRANKNMMRTNQAALFRERCDKLSHVTRHRGRPNLFPLAGISSRSDTMRQRHTRERECLVRTWGRAVHAEWALRPPPRVRRNHLGGRRLGRRRLTVSSLLIGC